MNVTLNSIRHNAESRERQKTSFPKELVKNADLYKTVSKKIMTTHEWCVRFHGSFKFSICCDQLILFFEENLKAKVSIYVSVLKVSQHVSHVKDKDVTVFAWKFHSRNLDSFCNDKNKDWRFVFQKLSK